MQASSRILSKQTMRLRQLFLVLLCASSTLLEAQHTDFVSKPSYVDLVNPLTGTLSSYELSAGNTYPVISRPRGMNSWTPQTGKMGDGWQYTYTATKLRGIKQTHQPSPWIGDYGQFSFLPQVGAQPRFGEEERASHFGHKAEQAHPYSYSVYLADYDTELRLAPTERAAVCELSYPEGSRAEERWIIVDAYDGGSELLQTSPRTLAGVSRRNSGGVPKGFACYFTLEFEHPIAELRYQRTETKEGAHVIAAVRLADRSAQQRFWLASSFVSPQQATLNLQEAAGRSFAEVATEGRAQWNELLGRLAVEDESPERMRTFYSMLYRCLLFPRRFWERNAAGEIIHYSPYNGRVMPGYMYTDTGYWDTFRALMPLVNLVYPEEAGAMAEGLMNAYRESGFLPEWASPGHRDCMVGNNSASVLTDAYLKGLGRLQGKEVLEALQRTAHSEHPTVGSTGRKGYKYYDALGYIPSDVGIKEHAARSLEYAYADWCIARAAERAGAPRKVQERYQARSQNYRKLYNPTLGWMQGRRADGSWQQPFSVYKWGDAFTEGNALHYSWSVFHDIPGLMQLMGGRESFVAKLDSIFALPPIFDESYYGFVIHEIREMQLMHMGNYAHGNQPIQHMIYLYDYADASAKTQWWVREVMNRLYSSAPDGYCGDEDNGQTSAWYVFSALGFYPVNPVSGEYALGLPYFKRVRLQRPGMPPLLITADKPLERYVQRMALQGQALQRPFVSYEALQRGGELHFELGPQPAAAAFAPR